MFFSEKYKLANEAKEWCDGNGAEHNAINIITFLDIKGYIKVQDEI